MRIDSHVYLSERHTLEHLTAILSRNRFDAAILVVDDPPAGHLPPILAGFLARRVDATPGLLGAWCPLAEVSVEFARDLEARGLPLDLEMRPADFPQLLRLAAQVPALRIAIDHLARPDFNGGMTDDWARGLESAAQFPRIACKISGLLGGVTQLPWSAAPLRPFVQHALSVFGPARVMFGSEWPARLPDIGWKENLAAFTQSIGAHSMEARELMLGETARAFYRIG